MPHVCDEAVLVLEDGCAYLGRSFGSTGETFGELVFATGMTGYQETLTDPSYFGQIVIQTAPQIGNTGVNDEDDESLKIWVSGYVVRNLSRIDSSWRADESLVDRMTKDEIVGISNLDTRQLTKKLRDFGSMKAGIFSGDKLTSELLELTKSLTFGEEFSAPEEIVNLVKNSSEMNGAHFAETVSTKNEYWIGPDLEKTNRHLKVVALDLGIKNNTPRSFSERGIETIILPINSTIDEVMIHNPDGVFFSNGPGDPSAAKGEIELLTEILSRKIPFFGICMGNQMLGRALGFQTYKLKFGHRGINQPVKDLKTNRVEITAHNHGFAVDLPIGKDVDSKFGKVRVSHVGLNDSVVEGIECLEIPAFSVQYHPEAAAGPHDASYLFDRFVDMMIENKNGNKNHG